MVNGWKKQNTRIDTWKKGMTKLELLRPSESFNREFTLLKNNEELKSFGQVGAKALKFTKSYMRSH